MLKHATVVRLRVADRCCSKNVHRLLVGPVRTPQTARNSYNWLRSTNTSLGWHQRSLQLGENQDASLQEITHCYVLSSLTRGFFHLLSQLGAMSILMAPPWRQDFMNGVCARVRSHTFALASPSLLCCGDILHSNEHSRVFSYYIYILMQFWTSTCNIGVRFREAGAELHVFSTVATHELAHDCLRRHVGRGACCISCAELVLTHIEQQLVV